MRRDIRQFASRKSRKRALHIKQGSFVPVDSQAFTAAPFGDIGDFAIEPGHGDIMAQTMALLTGMFMRRH